MPVRVQERVITSDDMVDDEGELVQYTLYVDTKPVNAAEASKDSRWMKAMMGEIKSIEENDSWSLVDPQ